MKSPLIKLTSNDDEDSWGTPIYVSVLAIQGIEEGDDLYDSDSDEKARHTHGTGETPIGKGARVYFANNSVMVRESVERVYVLVETRLKELATR